MGKVFCIIGRSGVGKSTLERKVSERLNFKRLISCTTRPMRGGEKEGVDYYYINNDSFQKLQEDNQLLESQEYRGWNYCISKLHNKFDLKNDNYICVVEPHGFKQLQENLGEKNVVSVYLYAPEKELLLRSLKREDNPDCEEICRRFMSDTILFKGIEYIVDYNIESLYEKEAFKSFKRVIELDNLISDNDETKL